MDRMFLAAVVARERQDEILKDWPYAICSTKQKGICPECPNRSEWCCDLRPL